MAGPAPGSQSTAAAPGPPANAAEWGERTGAALVDLTISLFLFFVGVVAGVIIVTLGGWAIAAGVALIVAGPAAAILYAPLMLARKGQGNGQTLGKRAVNLRVVRADGQPVTFWLGVLREFVVKQLIGIVLTGGLFWLVDSLWPLFDDQDHAIHDIVAETDVIKLGD
ncbi:MAG TPA: RDD family protein [Solirubrobacterales bacterium]|jgi:uncharacterized RDD family membrane protein YckC|nr:RDD family protein [Solirubrobacterales bacterium]HZA90243.1 RDD family protein [Solirubrobacterales bacterium]